MKNSGEDRGESAKPKRRRSREVKETFSISLALRMKERLDKEVEEGLWDSRSQAIGYYLHRGLESEKYAREYANRQLLVLDKISRTDKEGTDMLHAFLVMLKKPKFRRLLKELDESLLKKE